MIANNNGLNWEKAIAVKYSANPIATVAAETIATNIIMHPAMDPIKLLSNAFFE
jgi:hypothetical protein